MKKHEEALNCFQNICTKISQSIMDAFFQKGVQLAELGKHEKALEIFDEILSKHKDNVKCIIYAKSRSKAELGMISRIIRITKTSNIKKSKNNSEHGQKKNQYLQNYTTMINSEKLVKL